MQAQVYTTIDFPSFNGLKRPKKIGVWTINIWTMHPPWSLVEHWRKLYPLMEQMFAYTQMDQEC